MLNTNERDNKMEKVILVVEVVKYQNIPNGYSIKKVAKNLDEAAKYKVSLENLNDSKTTSYELFNGFGQFEVEEIKKVESDGADEIRF